MRIVCPRVIKGNRGDLSSRYGILSYLHQHNISYVTVFWRDPQDLVGLPFTTVSYGSFHNLIPTLAGLKALHLADTVFWTAGLDLQDDSCLIKILYINVVFALYRLLRIKAIYVIAQGAGPLDTKVGG